MGSSAKKRIHCNYWGKTTRVWIMGGRVYWGTLRYTTLPTSPFEKKLSTIASTIRYTTENKHNTSTRTSDTRIYVENFIYVSREKSRV
jgi:hypothetical protein